MDVGKGPMRITSTRNIAELDWAEVGADIVLNVPVLSTAVIKS